ncbi:hypothetical protein [Alicyclobacillus sp. ALC3]|uniref:hypothetical protein n=1 Tax=Alicyclobacillus sp. ALC3 TaxID=2796143 RepID=UPI0023795F79|nr:hypothetical protein [Alicyclobacillus sp. ALC3]WDL96932.1 hypothetical protein JC200_22080 [Alicyclobacillus sp. ALC3]
MTMELYGSLCEKMSEWLQTNDEPGVIHMSLTDNYRLVDEIHPQRTTFEYDGAGGFREWRVENMTIAKLMEPTEGKIFIISIDGEDSPETAFISVLVEKGPARSEVLCAECGYCFTGKSGDECPRCHGILTMPLPPHHVNCRCTAKETENSGS